MRNIIKTVAATVVFGAMVVVLPFSQGTALRLFYVGRNMRA